MNATTVDTGVGAYQLTINEKLDLIIHRMGMLFREIREIRLDVASDRLRLEEMDAEFDDVIREIHDRIDESRAGGER